MVPNDDLTYVAAERQEALRALLAKHIGHQMIAEGKKTGNDISYAVAHALRDEKNRETVLEGIGLDIERETTVCFCGAIDSLRMYRGKGSEHCGACGRKDRFTRVWIVEVREP